MEKKCNKYSLTYFLRVISYSLAQHLTILKNKIYVCSQSLSCVQLLATLRTMACQVPLSIEAMGFSHARILSGLPFPPPGDLLNPEIKTSVSCISCVASRFFTDESPGKSP